MPKKKNYITDDLDFAEEQLARWKKFTLDNPYDEVQDRKEMQLTKTGGSFYTVVQTKEQIQKNLRDTLKAYLEMLSVVDLLREKTETSDLRGGEDMPEMMLEADEDENNDE